MKRNPVPSVKGMLTIAEAAERAGVVDKTIRRNIDSGRLPAYRVANSRAFWIRPEDLDAFYAPVLWVPTQS